jgi:hypothetical protein
LDVVKSAAIGVPAVAVIGIDGGTVDYRIGVVHPAEIAGADIVSRKVGLAWSQGKPPYRWGIAHGEA